jgi:hypothetical protein
MKIEKERSHNLNKTFVLGLTVFFTTFYLSYPLDCHMVGSHDDILSFLWSVEQDGAESNDGEAGRQWRVRTRKEQEEDREDK